MGGFEIVVLAVALLGVGWFLGLIEDRVNWPWIAPLNDKMKFIFFGLFLLGTVLIIVEVLTTGTARG